jgi:hypothetical protein
LELKTKAYSFLQRAAGVLSKEGAHKLLRLASVIAPAKGAEGKCTPYYQVNPATVLLDTDGGVALQQMLL